VLRTALLALALPALLACSGGSTDGASGTPFEASRSGDSPVSEASAAEAQQLTEAQLKDTLPTLSDMPAIFSPTKSDGSDEEDKNFLCGADVDHFNQRNAEAKVGYGAQVGLSATQYSFGISQFDSPALAVEQLQTFGDVIDSCHKFTSHGDTYTVVPMSAGHSDDTVAVRLTTKSAGFAVAVNVLMVRTGSSLVASLSATIGLARGSTIDDVVRLTQETVDRYEAEAGIG
jgi:hypothetical protein